MVSALESAVASSGYLVYATVRATLKQDDALIVHPRPIYLPKLLS